jgi:hypothetical protein
MDPSNHLQDSDTIPAQGANPAPAARVIAIGKRQWVAGMLWRSFEEKPSRAELRQEGEDLRADWAALRVGEDAIQAGFCAAVADLKAKRSNPKKLLSLAAAVADARQQPWLGIYKVADGLWWYIAVRDGQAILPDGDVIGGEAEIYAARERHSGFGDWTYVEGSLNDLDALVDGVKPSPVFALNGAPAWVVPAAGLMITAVAAGGGGLWWHEHQLAAQRAHQLAIAKMRALLSRQQPAKALPSPLLTTPLPDAWLAACGSAIEKVSVSQDGWTVGEVSCAGNAASIVWQRMPGATTAVRPEGVLDPGGDKLLQSIPLDSQGAGLMPGDGRDNGQPLPVEESDLFALLQGMGVKATIQSAPAQPPASTLPGGESAGKAPAPATPQAQVHFTLPVAPFSVNWNAIPGFRISRIALSADGWHVEGVLYGR